MTRRSSSALLGSLVLGALLISAQPAGAAETGRIVEVDRSGKTLTVVFQADGLPDGVVVDPTTVSLRVAGAPVESEAKPLQSGDDVTRVSVLAIDNSKSMSGDKFAAAKVAATTFLGGVPDDVRVGLVTFGSGTDVAVAPTADHAAVQAAIDTLAIDATTGTALYDAVGQAADSTGDTGARNVLLLTDGNEDGSSTTTIDEAVAKATDDDVTVDAVYIGDAAQPHELSRLVTSAGGQVFEGGTADLNVIFGRLAAAIKNQVVVTASLPDGTPSSGNVEV
jgi:tight adherence protein B